MKTTMTNMFCMAAFAALIVGCGGGGGGGGGGGEGVGNDGISGGPGTPSNLIATAVSGSEVGLNWTAADATHDGFNVEQSTSPSTGFTKITSVGNTTSHNVIGLSPSTTYYFRVNAFNSTGSSGYTPVAEATTLSAQVDYDFPGGSLDDLKAVSPSLSFNNLTISGSLKIPSSEDSVTLSVANLTLKSTEDHSSVWVSYPTCSPYGNAPDLTINASGNVNLDQPIDLGGKTGRSATSDATCNSPTGTRGGSLTINAQTIAINEWIDTSGGGGGQTRDTFGSIGYDGQDAGDITLTAVSGLTIGASLDARGGTGARGSLTDGTNGSEGEIKWSGDPIVVTEVDDRNANLRLAQRIPYQFLTVNGVISSADDSELRANPTGTCEIAYSDGSEDFIEDFYRIDLGGTDEKPIAVAVTSASNLDIFLLDRCGSGATVFGKGNDPATGNESFMTDPLQPGIYYLGVSYVDLEPEGIDAEYQVILD